ncbi:hypothetical protein [Mycobacterium sp. URHB0044]|uniref:hypothetical protein n=1 Tax=Mycobacterium sp. URHB0044 TaxID=1380386 RepID=UPI0005652C4A
MRVLLAFAAMAASSVAAASSARADDTAPHHVTYTVTSERPTRADIYYRDVEPPNWPDYSHNPYSFSPKVEADLGPGSPWVLEVDLANPERWAMVSASSGLRPETPTLQCQLTIDGVVVKSGSGPKGALCSVRNW